MNTRVAVAREGEQFAGVWYISVSPHRTALYNSPPHISGRRTAHLEPKGTDNVKFRPLQPKPSEQWCAHAGERGGA